MTDEVEGDGSHTIDNNRRSIRIMGHISCVTITTLIVVSLANLMLLLTVVLETRRKCDGDYFDSKNDYKVNFGKRLLSFVMQNEVEFAEQKHLAALCVIKHTRVVLICGVTIVSSYWVLTAAHCCELVKIYPMEKIKISSNSPVWREGIAHDVDVILRHSNYTPKTVTHNICLVRVKTPFQDKQEIPAPIAGSRYKYAANSTATALGWNSKSDDHEDEELYSSKVILIPFSTCRSMLKQNIDDTMFCARHLQNVDCSYDSGGPLFQKDIVIGIVSFEESCSSRVIPRVYTRISYFEKWIEHVERLKKEKIGAIFKDK